MPANIVTYRSVTPSGIHNWKKFYQGLLNAILYNASNSNRSLLKISYVAGVDGGYPIFDWHMIAYKVGVPIGIITVSRNERHNSLMSVYVKPEHRGQGIGRHLIEAAWKRHPGSRGYHTEESRKLYLQIGVPHFADSDLLPSMLSAFSRKHHDVTTTI